MFNNDILLQKLVYTSPAPSLVPRSKYPTSSSSEVLASCAYCCEVCAPAAGVKLTGTEQCSCRGVEMGVAAAVSERVRLELSLAAQTVKVSTVHL